MSNSNNKISIYDFLSSDFKQSPAVKFFNFLLENDYYKEFKYINFSELSPNAEKKILVIRPLVMK